MLFKGTLKENIILRSPDASDEEILIASSISGAQRFVDIHPMGFDMPVGERGEGLSGGQSNVIQYITIATTGNATDFGDDTVAHHRNGACSNAGGGLALTS